MKRDALLEMASAMAPLSSLVLEPLRTDGHGPLATVWFRGSWISGGNPDPVHVRAVILWRKEADGRWRVALEHMA